MNYKEILDEKFMELSELFTKIKDVSNIEPEQKCAVIKAMLDIYDAYKS